MCDSILNTPRFVWCLCCGFLCMAYHALSGKPSLCGHGVRIPSLFRCTGKLNTPPFFSDIVVDNCAICRNHIMDLCTLTTSAQRPSLNGAHTYSCTHIRIQVSTVRLTRSVPLQRSATLHGVSVTYVPPYLPSSLPK